MVGFRGWLLESQGFGSVPNVLNNFHSLTCETIFRYLCRPENLDPQFHFEYRGPVAMKGKSEPMKVWFLQRSKEHIV